MTDPPHAPAPTGAATTAPDDLTTPEGAPDLTADHLPCGRPTDELLDLVLDGHAAPPDDRRDAHQRTCVHCRALAAEAEQLWSPVRADAATLETPPPDLLEAVIATVRTLGRDPVHLVIPGTRGVTRISADAIRQIAERAAATVPGVAIALARHARSEPDVQPGEPAAAEPGEPAAGEPDDPDGGEAATDDGIGLSGRHTVLDLAVVTSYGAPIPDVAAGARDAVRAVLAAMTTATDVLVDISVDGITHP